MDIGLLDHRSVIGEDPHHVRPSFDLAVEPLERVGRGYLTPVLARKAHVDQHLLARAVHQLNQLGAALPQATAVGIGGDPIIGTDFIEILKQFEADPETECAVMVGEIGGNAEQNAAEYVQSEMTKPVVAYIAGFTAPEGKTMGHAGAIVSGGESTAEAKSEALQRAGIRAATNPSEVAELVAEALGVSSSS